MPTEALTQSVEVPLWLLVLFLAYSENRVARLVGGAARLRRQSEPQERPAADEGR